MRVSAIEEQIREIHGELEINTDAHCKMREQIFALMGKHVAELGRREQRVLELLDEAGGQMSFGALAAEMNVSRYTLRRLLQNLKGYVETGRDPKSMRKKYVRLVVPI
ncbi:MAG: HTH domain-containing protein [Methanothrix sp.]|nr:HTH domain-containing protein [Methanothrix sp.]